MKIVFMGTPPFAVPSLEALAAEYEVAAVYTMPDRPAGRGRQPVPSAVKEAALRLRLPVVQPQSLRDDAAVTELRSLAPDLLVVAAYGAILPPALLEVPRMVPVNVHASLLPRWRGAAPVQHAILAGDELTGVSIMRMVEGLDAGPYCLQLATEVDGHTTYSLTAELARLGAEALLQALPALEDGSVAWTEQDESAVTYAGKITSADVALSPDLTVTDAYRRIRAASRQAPARACIGTTDVTVTDAVLSQRVVGPGSVHAAGNELVLGFVDGALEIAQLTPQGRASMPGAAYGRGARLGSDATWGASRAG